MEICSVGQPKCPNCMYKVHCMYVQVCYDGPMVRFRSFLLAVVLACDEALELSLELHGIIEGGREN